MKPDDPPKVSTAPRLPGIIGLMITLLIWLAVFLLFLAGCDSRPALECINLRTNDTLTVIGVMDPERMQRGIIGVDEDGFTHVVPRAQAPEWKCRRIDIKPPTP